MSTRRRSTFVAVPPLLCSSSLAALSESWRDVCVGRATLIFLPSRSPSVPLSLLPRLKGLAPTCLPEKYDLVAPANRRAATHSPPLGAAAALPPSLPPSLPPLRPNECDRPRRRFETKRISHFEFVRSYCKMPTPKPIDSGMCVMCACVRAESCRRASRPKMGFGGVASSRLRVSAGHATSPWALHQRDKTFLALLLLAPPLPGPGRKGSRKWWRTIPANPTRALNSDRSLVAFKLPSRWIADMLGRKE